MRIYIFILVLLWSLPISLHANAKRQSTSDKAIHLPKPYDYSEHIKYNGLDIKTYYVTMRDGVKLAVDLYLPKGLTNEKIPALIHQTRYWRAPQLRWPFSMFSDGLIGRTGAMIKAFASTGYAIVNVDARGSGASYGERLHPWTEDETKDGAEIIDWILKQEWSDGNVGSLGISYSGTTAEFLSFNQHPNLKAVMLMYSLYDVYDDIAFPGGIFQRHFVNDWGYYNSKLDADKIPRGGFFIKLLVKGVRRVKENGRKKKFKMALKDHEANMNVNQTAAGVNCRDDKPPLVDIESIDFFSPYVFADKINATNTAVYCYSGWMDGDYQHANIRRFLTLTNPQNKLTIGPWEHGGKFNCSPADPGLSGFDHVAEIMKFFDFHLKGKANGLYEEPKIHYFTMMEEAWKGTNTWPPKASTHSLYLDEENALSFNPPKGSNAFDFYQVDTSVFTGADSRWMSVIGKLKTPLVYPERKKHTEKLLHYDSAPLTQTMEISGHPLVHLFVKSDQTDGNFHVYLDEIDAHGNVNYITEGLLRGVHRKLTEEQPFYTDVVPQRTFYDEDMMPLEKGKIHELVFDMIPTSYQVKKGNRLRISIAGADQTHFAVMHKSEPKLEIYRDAAHPTRVELPIVQ